MALKALTVKTNTGYGIAYTMNGFTVGYGERKHARAETELQFLGYTMGNLTLAVTTQ